jgi:hypothetical protein
VALMVERIKSTTTYAQMGARAAPCPKGVRRVSNFAQTAAV